MVSQCLQDRGVALRPVRRDVQFGSVVLFVGLPYLDAGVGPPVYGMMKVHAGWRLVIPQYIQPYMDAPNLVINLIVAVIVESVSLDVRG
jgi:hypothetical protein